MKILISAAEVSSDAHGAELLKAIQEKMHHQSAGSPVDAFGMGGPKLQSMEFRAVVDAKELLVIGYLEVLSRLPKIFNALNRMSQAAVDEKPDVAVFIDYPEFHFKLAKRLKKSGIPIVYYIPPKVWVWRKNRVKFLRDFFSKVLCILPFEESFYKTLQVSAKYVGNPLLDELPLHLTRAEARQQLGLASNDKVLVLMPGSRPAEIKRHLELMLESAVRAAAYFRAQGFLRLDEQLKILIPFPEVVDLEILQTRVSGWMDHYTQSAPFILDLRVSKGDAAVCMIAADAGLIKSGTSTLEAGMLGCPHTVVYKPNIVTEFIFKKIMRYKGPVGLVNLVYGGLSDHKNNCIVKEVVCNDATVLSLSEEIRSLFMDRSYIEKVKEGLLQLKKIVLGKEPYSSPSARAASEVIELVRCQRS